MAGKRSELKKWARGEPTEVLTFAVPWPKFVRMVDNMEESFLTTDHWNKIRLRIKRRSNRKTTEACSYSRTGRI